MDTFKPLDPSSDYESVVLRMIRLFEDHCNIFVSLLASVAEGTFDKVPNLSAYGWHRDDLINNYNYYILPRLSLTIGSPGTAHGEAVVRESIWKGQQSC